MLKKEYNAINTKNIKDVFKDYITCITIPEIDYFAIGIQNILLKTSISLMSRTEWQDKQDKYVKNNYAHFDPVRKAVFSTKRTIILFSELDHCSTLGKEIMRQRTLEGIKDGLIFVKHGGAFNTMLTLGTGYSRFDSYKFLEMYYNKIAVMKNDLFKIIEKEARTFMTHLSDDAK